MEDDGRWVRPHGAFDSSGGSLHLYDNESSDGELTFETFVEEPPTTAECCSTC